MITTKSTTGSCLKLLTAGLLTASLGLALGLATGAGTAKAGDIQGDAYSCQELWVMRNQIFKNNGYCFQTDRARNYFGNGGCRFASEGAVPLSKSGRRIIRDIRASERRLGC